MTQKIQFGEQMNDHNPLKQYFRRPAMYLKLPSQGKFYDETVVRMPENGELPVYPMTAIDEITARNIRTDLRNAFAQWSERNNLGSPEKAYREAFRAEKVAQAKDEIPYVISQYGERADARKLASQIAKDPELKPILGAAIRQKLANTPVEKLKSEFEKEKSKII